MKRLLFLGLMMLCRHAAFAWQVTSQAGQVKESGTNWGLWILGVILVLGAGILVYVFIKKDPRQDAR